MFIFETKFYFDSEFCLIFAITCPLLVYFYLFMEKILPIPSSYRICPVFDISLKFCHEKDIFVGKYIFQYILYIFTLVWFDFWEKIVIGQIQVL